MLAQTFNQLTNTPLFYLLIGILTCWGALTIAPQSWVDSLTRRDRLGWALMFFSVLAGVVTFMPTVTANQILFVVVIVALFFLGRYLSRRPRP